MALGCYGLRLTGVEEARTLLGRVAAEAPAYRIAAERGPTAGGEEWVDGQGARLRLREGGELRIDREAGTIVVRAPEPLTHGELLHPFLAPAAGVISFWEQRESLHAGAIAAGGDVWAILGDREAGKSSTLAWLAGEGVDVVSDDLLVLDGTAALAGPRCLDLRGDAARRLGIGTEVGGDRGRERWRVDLDPVTGPLTLRGCVYLEWGDRVALRAVAGAERLRRLIGRRGVNLPTSRPEALVELAALPAWELVRRKDWASLGPAGRELLALAGR